MAKRPLHQGFAKGVRRDHIFSATTKRIVIVVGFEPILVPFSFSRYCETSWRVLKSCLCVCNRAPPGLVSKVHRTFVAHRASLQLSLQLSRVCASMPAEEAERKEVPGSVHVSPPCTTYSAAHRTVVEYQSRGSFHIHSLQFVPFAQFPGSRTSS